MKNKVSHRVENIARQGENSWCKQFLPFLTMFSTANVSLVRQNAALCGNWLTHL